MIEFPKTVFMKENHDRLSNFSSNKVYRKERKTYYISRLFFFLERAPALESSVEKKIFHQWTQLGSLGRAQGPRWGPWSPSLYSDTRRKKNWAKFSNCEKNIKESLLIKTPLKPRMYVGWEGGGGGEEENQLKLWGIGSTWRKQPTISSNALG